MWRIDGQTDGREALQYLPSRAFGAAGDKNADMVQQQLIFESKPTLKPPRNTCDQGTFSLYFNESLETYLTAVPCQMLEYLAWTYPSCRDTFSGIVRCPSKTYFTAVPCHWSFAVVPGLDIPCNRRTEAQFLFGWQVRFDNWRTLINDRHWYLRLGHWTFKHYRHTGDRCGWCRLRQSGGRRSFSNSLQRGRRVGRVSRGTFTLRFQQQCFLCFSMLAQQVIKRFDATRHSSTQRQRVWLKITTNWFTSGQCLEVIYINYQNKVLYIYATLWRIINNFSINCCFYLRFEVTP